MGNKFIFFYQFSDFCLRSSVIKASLVPAKVTAGKDEKF